MAGDADLERVAEIERQTRHDVVAHLRHFAEQAGEAGAILHLGATSMFVVDNTDGLLVREALRLVERRLTAAIRPLAEFARRHRALPTLAYTHLQPAQLTTVGKRACLWLQDLLLDLEAVRRLVAGLRCRGAKGTTGTQASYLELFDGDHEKVKALDRLVTAKLGFERLLPGHRPDLSAQAGQPGAGGPGRGRRELPPAGRRRAPAAGPGRALRAVRPRPGRLLGDGLQAQPGAQRAACAAWPGG